MKVHSGFCSPGGQIICRCQYLGPYNCNGPILHSIDFAKRNGGSHWQDLFFPIFANFEIFSCYFSKTVFYLTILDKTGC